jgi:hypothetical protein
MRDAGDRQVAPPAPRSPTTVLRWVISALVAAGAGVGTFATLTPHSDPPPLPVVWVAAASAALVAFPSTYAAYAALGGWRDRREPVERDAWRRHLILAVQHVWITGTLRSPDSLPVIAAMSIPLMLTARAGLVQPRTHKRLVDPRQRRLAAGVSFGGLFEESGRSLLLLGPPGGGKTTLLLRLANALLATAESAGDAPVPVVFNLASWTERRGPLVQWLADRFARDYQVPRVISREWVELGSVVLLLDGLDEVPAEHRDACIAAINDYRREHPANPVLVCGRTADYTAARTRLQLNTAVEIAVLDTDAVDRYLAAAGPALAGVRALLASDPLLRDVANSPFLLNIAALTYRSPEPGDTIRAGSVDRRRAELLNDYLEQSLGRWAPASPVPLATRLHWLRWLAGALRDNNQAVLHLLWMQPRLVEPHARARTVVRVAALLSGLGGLVISGLVGAVLANLPHEVPIDIPRPILYPLSVAFIAGATAAAGHSRLFAPPIQVRWTTASLAADAPRGATAFAVTSLLVGAFFWRIGGPAAGAVAGSTFGFILSLALIIQSTLRALRTEESEDGRCMSGRHLLLVAGRYGIPFGLVVGIIYGSVAAAAFRPVVGIMQGAAVAVAFSACGTYFLWLAIGGRSYLQHFALRIALVRRGCLPWRLERFLDDMVTSTVMRKHGTGYAFIHDLLHAHLLGEGDALAQPTRHRAPSAMLAAPRG